MNVSRLLSSGTSAPDFTLPRHDGGTFRLADHAGSSPVVLFFYPQDGTAGCTAEACAFRDSFDEFARFGAVVAGISDDSPESHREFASRHSLPYVLLSDEHGRVAALYGVPRFLFIKGRVTVVIDRDGIVHEVFSSMVRFSEHKQRALAALRRISGS